MKDKVLLSCKNMSKVFGNGKQSYKALNEINFNIYNNDFTVIMGTSGAGKSTFLYSLSGMDSITEGDVYYKDILLSNLTERKMSKLRAKEFGFVFQQAYLISNLTLMENIITAGFLSDSGTEVEIIERAKNLCKLMNIENAKDRLPKEVSGGEAQRAAIAVAVIGNPGIIFADEPTGALNKSNTVEVLNLLTQLNRDGQTILMVTHDIKAAIRGNRVVYMDDGRLIDEIELSNYSELKERQREDLLNDWLQKLEW